MEEKTHLEAEAAGKSHQAAVPESVEPIITPEPIHSAPVVIVACK
jgi:hypothetical protein